MVKGFPVFSFFCYALACISRMKTHKPDWILFIPLYFNGATESVLKSFTPYFAHCSYIEYVYSNVLYVNKVELNKNHTLWNICVVEEKNGIIVSMKHKMNLS